MCRKSATGFHLIDAEGGVFLRKNGVNIDRYPPSLGEMSSQLGMDRGGMSWCGIYLAPKGTIDHFPFIWGTIMKDKEHTKFSWCPVCMVHTYHRKSKLAWECLGDHHHSYLKLRKDPWIEDYKKERASLTVAIEEQT